MNVSDEQTDVRSRYVVGIDLGTTNCALGYVDTTEEEWSVSLLEIPQWVDWGQIEKRKTLPSFLYQPTDELRSSVSRGLPWDDDQPQLITGMLARDAGLRHPGRRISSAKSWLSHDAVDRWADLLPWHGDADVQRMSPVEASSHYLLHLRQTWDHQFPNDPLSDQDVIITLPASFDEVARELTIAAAKRAGLPRVYLIEEPQAAFYAWIDNHRTDWFERATAGQMILVCDIGGGTSDFTLIRVRPAGAADEQVQFHRVAVGKHLILGGDNLDLALAKFVEPRFAASGELPPRDWDRLIQVCRSAKETMLGTSRPDVLTLTLPSEGSRLIGGARTAELSADEVDTVLLDGFFPAVDATAQPHEGASGFREFGLPYADDPAITRHLAAFLQQHARAGLEATDSSSATRPDLILFNGGVMNADRLCDRITDCVANWFANGSSWRPTVLDAKALDLAVAHGAAYYGMVRRGRGVRIAANLGRSYYMQVADQPPETMCVIPGSAEAGQSYQPAVDLMMELGQPVQFPLWVSSTRLADQAGQLVNLDPQHLTPLPPIRTVLTRGRRQSQQQIQVRIETELSEIGTLSLFCVEVDSGQRWKLEFDIRSTLETDRQSHQGAGEAAGIVDSQTVDACRSVLVASFGEDPSLDPIAPGKVMSKLKGATDVDRGQWPPSLLRQMWHALMDLESGRRRSPAHEARWLNLIGYCLRPGYGMAVDDWRVSQVWRTIHGKLAHPAPSSRTESLILWRRIAGGLSGGQQQQLALPAIGMMSAKGAKLEPHEGAELWRMLGSLELIPIAQKKQLLDLACELLKKKNAAVPPEPLIWAIGRLSSRQLVYGPLNSVVPADQLAPVINQLLGSQSESSSRQLALVQMVQATGDRYRDCTPALREEVIQWLRQTSAPSRYIDRVLGGDTLDSDDEAALFGDSLPLGIRLLR